jgi:hypothetical protein
MAISRMVSIFLLGLMLWPALGQVAKRDPVTAGRTKTGGVVESALSQINPQKTDYGCQIAQSRQILVDHTVRSIDWWVIIIAISLLAFTALLVVYQSREQSRREIIAAGLLAQYHNAWVDARCQAFKAILRHNELVERKTPPSNNFEESTSIIQGTHLDRPKAAISTDARLASAAPDVDVSISRKKARTSKVIQSSQSCAPPDLIAQISVLQQQLEAARERERNLAKKLNQS